MFVPARPLKPSLIFVGKARNLLKSETLEKCFTCVSFSLTRKHYIRLESPVWYKHSSLLFKFVNYGREKFYNIGPRSMTPRLGSRAGWLVASKSARILPSL